MYLFASGYSGFRLYCMALHLQRRVGVTGAAHPDSQPHTSYLGPATGLGPSWLTLENWGLLLLPLVTQFTEPPQHSCIRRRRPVLSPAVTLGSPGKRNAAKSICISVFGINKSHNFPGQYPRVPQDIQLPLLEAQGAGHDSQMVQVLEKQR